MKTSHQLTEQDLVRGCLAGKRAVQRQLYDQYCDAMFCTARRMMSSNDLAADVVQEAFIQVFKNLRSYRGDSSLGSWIKRIVCNTGINHLRKQKMMETLDESNSHQMSTEMDVHFDDHLLKKNVLMKALDKLPSGYRTILSLYLLEGYDHGEIAQILSIAEGTSKSQYLRAKKKLKALTEEML